MTVVPSLAVAEVVRLRWVADSSELSRVRLRRNRSFHPNLELLNEPHHPNSGLPLGGAVDAGGADHWNIGSRVRRAFAAFGWCLGVLGWECEVGFAAYPVCRRRVRFDAGTCGAGTIRIRSRRSSRARNDPRPAVRAVGAA